MKKIELLLPVGNEECLRAAVNNGADAVYLGLSKFNARRSAGNFSENSLAGVVDYCHKRSVKVYVAMNTLVKNDEIDEYFRLIGVACSSAVDAVIVQDLCLVSLIRENFPGLHVHLSTQANTVNFFSVPDGVDRVVLARELSFDEVKEIAGRYETEIFVHGALCFCYSGLCLFSSLAGGRSANRGMCAQPCRMIYNNKYVLSTMDLCLVRRIPELIDAGVSSLKVEGRMRSSLYVGTVARIYRKYIDAYYRDGGKVEVDDKDIMYLKMVFNREFTEGFGFCDNVVDSRKPMNRGVFIGTFRDGVLKLREGLKCGDGVGIWCEDKIRGYTVCKMIKDGVSVDEGICGDEVVIDTCGAKDGDPVYKTSSIDIKIELGDPIKPFKEGIISLPVKLPVLDSVENDSPVQIFAKAYSLKDASALDESKVDVVYYDVMNDDCKDVKGLLKYSRFFVSTPRVLSREQVVEVVRRIKDIGPDGVLVGNRGLLGLLKDYEVHLDYSFNCFNDVDLAYYSGIPVISPELNFREVSMLRNKRFIVLVHGDIVLMSSRQKLRAPELVDNDGRHFRVRENSGVTEILNYKQVGLFGLAYDYVEAGVKYFYIDVMKDADKFVRIYRRILSSLEFNDSRIKKGYTTGHFVRGVS